MRRLAIQDLSPLEEVDCSHREWVGGQTCEGNRKQADQQGGTSRDGGQTPSMWLPDVPCTTCQQ